MRRTAIAALAVATLVGAGAGAALTTDDDASRHPMMNGGTATLVGGSADGWTMGGPMMGGPIVGAPMMGGSHVAAASEPEFLAEMIAHHEEAIRAARELSRSERATMRDFGERIVEDQSAQVALMRAWLEEWYPEQSLDVDYQPMMRDLTDLSGDRLDRTFLEDMVWHHMAAVMASQHLLASRLVEHDEVGELAADIRDDQRAEILQMRRWLQAWFGVYSMP